MGIRIDGENARGLSQDALAERVLAILGQVVHHKRPAVSVVGRVPRQQMDQFVAPDRLGQEFGGAEGVAQFAVVGHGD